MGLLVIWIGTTITSFCLEIANELRIFKDAADAGYKIRLKKVSTLSGRSNPHVSKAVRLSLIVPVYNMFAVLQRTMLYNKVRPVMLDLLYVMGALEEMTEIEKQEYLKNPTALNALLVPLKMEIRLSKALSVGIDDGNENSTIFFEFGESSDDIIILKAVGDASRLSVEEQKKKVNEVWEIVLTGGMEEFDDELDDTDDLDSGIKLEPQMSDSELEMILESLDNSSLEEQNNDREKGPTLTKKLK